MSIEEKIKLSAFSGYLETYLDFFEFLTMAEMWQENVLLKVREEFPVLEPEAESIFEIFATIGKAVDWLESQTDNFDVAFAGTFNFFRGSLSWEKTDPDVDLEVGTLVYRRAKVMA